MSNVFRFEGRSEIRRRHYSAGSRPLQTISDSIDPFDLMGLPRPHDDQVFK